MDEPQNLSGGTGEEHQAPEVAQDVVETTQASGNILSLLPCFKFVQYD
jgi:hypothetical protein